MPKIKWGIIGTGSIANAFAHSIKYCDHSELVSVYGRNKDTMDEFSKKFSIDTHLDIESLLFHHRQHPEPEHFHHQTLKQDELYHQEPYLFV